MPFKHNTARRHRIPQARYRVTNSLGALLRSWPAYEAGLRRRGDLTVWVDEAALAGWQAPRRSTPGGKHNHAETTMGRYKHLIGPKLRARSRPAQFGEVALAVQVLNRMIREAKSVSVRR